MPVPTIQISVPHVYGNRETAMAVAERLSTMIGDQPSLWTIEISEAKNESGWLIAVSGEDNVWSCVFDGLDQRPDIISDYFRVQLAPYLSR